jgi:DNA-binding MurR/RpiR family transcriptional regulator
MLDGRKSLPKRIAQIAAYSLDNPDEIAFGTAASIATAAGVQPSTLIRFAQHFGYDGFTSMQVVFRGRLLDRNASYEDRLQSLRVGGADTESANVLDGFMAASVRSVNSLADSFHRPEFEAAVATLQAAETIYIVAKRRSFPIASYLAYIFGKLKVKNCLVDSSSGLDIETVSFASPGDAAIAISFSPYASETISHAGELSQRSVPVISITDSAFSPLTEFSKTCFEVVEADYAGFRTLAASMALAAALAVRVAEARASQAADKA